MFRSHTDRVRKPVKSRSRDDKDKKLKYYCNICTEGGWLSETDVEIHRKNDHNDYINSLVRDTKKHVCLICTIELDNKESLVAHIKTDHLFTAEKARRVDRDIFICEHCSSIFFNKKLLALHIALKHMEVRIPRLECPKCDANVRTATMWYHLQQHELPSVASCAICLQKCKNTTELQAHIKTHPYKYFCDMCQYETKKESMFEDHIVTKHRNKCVKNVKMNQDVRRFFVPHGKEPVWRYQVQNGLKGVYLRNMYVCILCREICMNKLKMKRHILKDHAPEIHVRKKPMCLCGEEFFNNVLLKHHIFKMKGDHRMLEPNEAPQTSYEVPVVFDIE